MNPSLSYQDGAKTGALRDLYGRPQGDLLHVQDKPQESQEAGHQEGLHEEENTSSSTTPTITTTIVLPCGGLHGVHGQQHREV